MRPRVTMHVTAPAQPPIQGQDSLPAPRPIHPHPCPEGYPGGTQVILFLCHQGHHQRCHSSRPCHSHSGAHTSSCWHNAALVGEPVCPTVPFCSIQGGDRTQRGGRGHALFSSCTQLSLSQGPELRSPVPQATRRNSSCSKQGWPWTESDGTCPSSSPLALRKGLNEDQGPGWGTYVLKGDTRVDPELGRVKVGLQRLPQHPRKRGSPQCGPLSKSQSPSPHWPRQRW